MNGLQLDFLRPAGPDRRLSLALALTGAALLALAVWHPVRLQGEVRQLDARLEQARSDRAVGGLSRGAAPRRVEPDEATRQALARAQQVQAALSIGWGRLFRTLESQRVPGVSLLAVQREASGAQRLRITARAARLEDAVAYLALLSRVDGLSQVHLVAHEPAGEGEPAGVRFALLADWAGRPGPVEPAR